MQFCATKNYLSLLIMSTVYWLMDAKLIALASTIHMPNCQCNHTLNTNWKKSIYRIFFSYQKSKIQFLKHGYFVSNIYFWLWFFFVYQISLKRTCQPYPVFGLSNISYNFDSYNCISYNFNSYNFDSYNFSIHIISTHIIFQHIIIYYFFRIFILDIIY